MLLSQSLGKVKREAPINDFYGIRILFKGRKEIRFVNPL
jgi:hypothetical protein